VGKVNWSRVVSCGLLTGVVWIILGSVVTALSSPLYRTIVWAPQPPAVLFNLILDLLEGISILWLYAAIHPHYRPDAKTAVIGAFAWWFIVTLGDATWCSFGFCRPKDVIPLMIGTRSFWLRSLVPSFTRNEFLWR